MCNFYHYFFQDVLTDLRLFLQGVNRERQVSNQALTKSALYLLQTLPVARHAVFEYLCNVFEEAVQIQMKQLQFHEFNQDDLGDDTNSSLRLMELKSLLLVWSDSLFHCT